MTAYEVDLLGAPRQDGRQHSAEPLVAASMERGAPDSLGDGMDQRLVGHADRLRAG